MRFSDPEVAVALVRVVSGHAVSFDGGTWHLNAVLYRESRFDAAWEDESFEGND